MEVLVDERRLIYTTLEDELICGFGDIVSDKVNEIQRKKNELAELNQRYRDASLSLTEEVKNLRDRLKKIHNDIWGEKEQRINFENGFPLERRIIKEPLPEYQKLNSDEKIKIESQLSKPIKEKMYEISSVGLELLTGSIIPQEIVMSDLLFLEDVKILLVGNNNLEKREVLIGLSERLSSAEGILTKDLIDKSFEHKIYYIVDDIQDLLFRDLYYISKHNIKFAECKKCSCIFKTIRNDIALYCEEHRKEEVEKAKRENYRPYGRVKDKLFKRCLSQRNISLGYSDDMEEIYDIFLEASEKYESTHNRSDYLKWLDDINTLTKARDFHDVSAFKDFIAKYK